MKMTCSWTGPKYPVEPGWILMRMLRDARRVGESAQGT